MLFHEVSWMPINLRTPSRMSRIMSGGARRDLISERDSDFMFPTADLASSMRGSTSANSLSMSFFLKILMKQRDLTGKLSYCWKLCQAS